MGTRSQQLCLVSEHSGYCTVLLCDCNKIMVLHKIPHCGQLSLPLPLLFTKYNLYKALSSGIEVALSYAIEL